MDYMPPGRVVKIGDERFARYTIVDCIGQYWARDHWSNKPADAVLFYREVEAVEARNRHCLGGDEPEVFRATILLTVHPGRWLAKQLVRFLKRHRQFFIGGPSDKEGILMEIIPDTLKKVEP